MHACKHRHVYFQSSSYSSTKNQFWKLRDPPKWHLRWCEAKTECNPKQLNASCTVYHSLNSSLHTQIKNASLHMKPMLTAPRKKSTHHLQHLLFRRWSTLSQVIAAFNSLVWHYSRKNRWLPCCHPCQRALLRNNLYLVLEQIYFWYSTIWPQGFLPNWKVGSPWNAEPQSINPGWHSQWSRARPKPKRSPKAFILMVVL